MFQNTRRKHLFTTNRIRALSQITPKPSLENPMKMIPTLLSAVATLSLMNGVCRADKTIEITGNDQMQYSLKEFEVTAGEKVTIVFKNVGQLPKVAMGHNVVVLKADVQVPAFCMKAMQAQATDYIPASEKDSIIAHTKVMGPGESETIEFTAPAAGTYPYCCTFPGHFAVMQGKMIVK